MKRILVLLLLLATPALASTTATRQYNFVDDRNNGVPITASRMDAEFDNVIAKLNQKAIISASTPSAPIAGMLWVDTTNKYLKQYRNSEWVIQGIVHVGTASPVTMQSGDLWVDTSGTENVLKIRNLANSGWITVISDLTAPGPIGSVTPSTGAFSTLNVGTTNQGDILYDNGTSFIRLTPGTSTQLLETQGASANPQWVNPITAYDYGTSASAFTTYYGKSLKIAYGNISVANKSSTALSNLPFTSSTSYKCFGNQVAGTLSLMVGPAAISYSSGSAANIHNAADTTFTISWMCIGT